MANNFKAIIPAGSTSYYVSKAGDDSKDGKTPENAKATVSGVMAAIAALSVATQVYIVVGTGLYEEAVTSTKELAQGSQMVADGQVTFRGNSVNNFSLAASPGCVITGFTIENYASVAFRNGVINCTVRNCSNVAPGISNAAVNNSIFINCTINGQPNITSSIFIDCVLSGPIVYMQSSYFNANCLLTMNMVSTVSNNPDFNNIMGMLRNGTTGTYKNFADFKADFPTYNINSINMPPKFNNPAKYDFTLQADSPHIGAGSFDGLKNIGGTSYGVPYVTSIAPQWSEASGAMISRSDGNNPDLVMSGNDLVLAPGKTSGQITSAPMRISLNPAAIQLLQYNGFLGFNKSQVGGSATNNNVPDANVYVSNASNGAGNPDRLSYEMRWTDNDVMPGSDIDWTVTPIVAPGTYLNFEWNTQPLFDTMGFGNGSALFNKNASPSPVSAVWIQVRVTLTNNYV